MRNLVEGNVLKVRAIGGLHVVTLAWDFVEGKDGKKKGLLGFAIERAEYDNNGKELERYYLRGIKRFEHKDEGAPPGSPFPTSEHPIQSFQWGDYKRKRPRNGCPLISRREDGRTSDAAISWKIDAREEGSKGGCRKRAGASALNFPTHNSSA